MSDDFIDPTPEGRRNLLLLLLLGIVLGGALQFWLKPAFFASLHSLPPCDQLKWLRVCLIAALATPPLLTLWAIPHSLKMLKYKQSPLPGAWVFRRTPVRRGRAVQLQAFFLLLVSAFCLAFPFLGWQVLKSSPIFAPTKVCILEALPSHPTHDRHARAPAAPRISLRAPAPSAGGRPTRIPGISRPA